MNIVLEPWTYFLERRARMRLLLFAGVLPSPLVAELARCDGVLRAVRRTNKEEVARG